MIAFAFLVLFAVPVFGGDVTVTFETTSEAACLRLRKVITRELDKQSLRYQAGPCIAVPDIELPER